MKTVHLAKGKVSHWSTAMYGGGPGGYVHAYRNAGGNITLSINTQVNVVLTDGEAKQWAAMLREAVKS